MSNQKQQQAIRKAQIKISSLTTAQICEVFEETNNREEDTSTVRGWLMDELETRDPESFAAWMDAEDADLMNKPSNFFK